MWHLPIPEELQRLVREQAAAMCLQRSWLRYSRCAHVRHPSWPRLREQLLTVLGPDAYGRLERFSGVRREWRQEPDSWLHVEDPATLLQEAEEEGWWGLRS